MPHLSAVEMLLLVSVIAGAVHVIAPDHWVPASILSWQRGWRLIQSFAFSSAALLIHLLLGFGIYLLIANHLDVADSKALLIFGISLVSLVALVRAFRFSKRRELLRTGRNGVWGFLTVLSFLGPSESLIPILIKAKLLGVGYLAPFAAFAVGSLVMGCLLVRAGRLVWDRPLWLPRGMTWAHQRRMVIPVATCMVIGLGFLFKIN